jgi:hypothetical protein
MADCGQMLQRSGTRLLPNLMRRCHISSCTVLPPVDSAAGAHAASRAAHPLHPGRRRSDSHIARDSNSPGAWRRT